MPDTNPSGTIWRIVYDESSDDEVHGSVVDRVRAWRTVEDPDGHLADDALKVDLMSTRNGDRVRIWVKG